MPVALGFLGGLTMMKAFAWVVGYWRLKNILDMSNKYTIFLIIIDYNSTELIFVN
jgi:hypothetical protein